MQITCPSCDARYDVPDSVMPPGGRDVQCSACGRSWYQLVARTADQPAGSETAPGPGQNSAAGTPPNAAAEPDEAGAESDAETHEARRIRRLRAALDGHKARAGQRALPLTQSEAAATVTEVSDGPDDTAVAAPARRDLDPEVAAVLRAEAEFERRARLHGTAHALEIQPDLGLSSPARKPRGGETVRDRLARLQAAERGAQSPLLPEGEESLPDPAPLADSMRSASYRPELPEPGPAGLPVRAQARDMVAYREAVQARRSFRWGFAGALLACLALPMVYLATPELARLFPSQGDLFARVAETGAEMHVALAGTVTDWLDRFEAWLGAQVGAAPGAGAPDA